ncbi:ATPase, V0 complex, c/d subunit [Carpediemonas membranifera]|uniref:V-type proton ATPase subunit n=1 Tax=Carpediemonas membranifera TaxID=201153 RepID=A0A8J6AYM2_9EUKA|nr:ATPase, V0 complex, c/d subunit [Carpediemonas membranifera]|eukprot:KAG9394635.1 ATPase, V0 complex, c/d subunit [Carpediemonas membranifera]
MVKKVGSCPSLATYANEFGFLEGVVKTHYNDFLSSSDYLALNECENISDFIVQLNGTRYCQYVQHHRDDANLEPSVIHDAMMRKFVDDYNFLLDNAIEPLLTFLRFCTYGHMIDNTILIIQGTLQGREPARLIKACHPLGRFDGIGALSTARSAKDLYDRVLIDTPIAKYFEKAAIGGSAEDTLTDSNIELLRNSLHKHYLEDFLELIKELGGDTYDEMKPLLDFEADRRAINISINSLNSDITAEERRALMPRMGVLFPCGTDQLVNRDSLQGVGLALSRVDEYHHIFVAGSEDDLDSTVSIEDGMYKLETAMARQAMYRGFCFAPFYGFFKLREQEIRNVMWLAERVHLGLNEGVSKLPIIRD